MFSINMDQLGSLSAVELQEKVQELDEHIKGQKMLEHKVGTSFLNVIDKKMHMDKDIPSLDVLEDLRAILIRSQEMGLGESCKKQLDTIRKLVRKIGGAHPIGNFVEELPVEISLKILSELDPKEIARLQLVSRSWRNLSPQALIEAINTKKIPMRHVFGTAENAIRWLLFNPTSKPPLKYADFYRVDNFGNEALKLLTKSCPDLQFLGIMGTKVGQLEALSNVRNLQGLDVDINLKNATEFENLKYVPKLKELFIKFAPANFCEYLKHTPDLESLSIHVGAVKQLDLSHNPKLRNLELPRCAELEKNALDNLHTHTPKLESLDIGHNSQLDADNVIKNLKRMPNLREVYLDRCPQFKKDHLESIEQQGIKVMARSV